MTKKDKYSSSETGLESRSTLKKSPISSNNTKVAVAMSGGVDSSVTAALMVEKYGKKNVFGVTMKLFCYGAVNESEKACCSVEAVNDAKSICTQLGIAHYVINLGKEFEDAVIRNFISEYQQGHTPIPCVQCNTVVKFDYLQKKVLELGADYLATGHYARISQNSKFKIQYKLLRGKDETKDQSYFLYGLTQEQLARTLFPVGDIKKTETRKIAAKLGLKTATKKESQGICFVVGERVTDWLKGKVKIKPGEIVDMKGEKLGNHDGVIFYTVGQRKGIGGGYADPMYVVKIDAAKNQVIIGTEKDLYRKELAFMPTNWLTEIKFPLKCTAKIRYNMNDSECIIQTQNTKYKTQKSPKNHCLKPDTLSVRFTEPQRAITPGQSIVFYDGEVVLGGGIIVG